MEGLLNTTNLPISPQTTVEDIINFSKSEIQSFLRANHLKISGNKLTLGQRIVDTIHKSKNTTHDQGVSSINEDKTEITLDPQESKVPCITELTAGWSGNDDKFHRISITDIENYLIHSSHRTNDAGKMQCYRQYIRGLNFYKEGYIHKMMINENIPDSPVSYVRSKCYPSMQKGVYEQWVLISKHAPFQILKANCTCPAGNGEGCTHVAGLLFALEGRPITPVEDDDSVPCTSKPCQWNQPSKRKKETRPVKDLTFKRIRYEDNISPKQKKTPKYKVDPVKFRDTLCAKLGNQSKAALFDIIAPSSESSLSVSCDLNVSYHEEVETSEYITYASDRFIDLTKTVQDEQMCENEVKTFMSSCSSEVRSEIELRTRGQHENSLWTNARKGRITASYFHDIKSRKDSTKADTLLSKVFGENSSFDNSALQWGRKQEPIAKKRYKAHKKLKEGKTIKLTDNGLIVHPDYSYIGASPDGIVTCESETFLLEIKCPYKWRNCSILEACKHKEFYCYVADDNTIQLKKTHRNYTQVQGQWV